MARRPKQLSLPAPRTWGGRRRGAGRKRKSDRANTPHRARPLHHADHPLHITMRLCSDLPSLRRRDLFLILRNVLATASRDGFSLIHFSVMGDHVHLIVEARDTAALSSGMRSLAIRGALALNRALGRKGRVWGDRYHSRALRSQPEVRNVLVYVLLNWQKHFGKRGVDPCSSGPWFDGWSPTVRVRPPPCPSPVAAAQTWLLRKGWRERGLLDPWRQRG